ncbi:hypothetical protein DQM68_01285 [Leptospira mayottensis]|uniref:DUF1564 family protein n=1 Tax=Leptospira mayottensis TaxID=1137606 RepID=A0ABN5NRH7_9LEPT|nr:hypothetical protein DQM68_01285 [Leptospira mayottensis]AXR63333.1 hypothetical protein DQM28_02930 [Leptospira mayottensis]AZQ01133.1 hypothetical protein LEP1GSC190_02700 [Leptospira mayottensis 200901116]
MDSESNSFYKVRTCSLSGYLSKQLRFSIFLFLRTNCRFLIRTESGEFRIYETLYPNFIMRQESEKNG